MARKIERIRDVLNERFPESSLEPLSVDEIQSLREQFPDIPGHLVEFFETIGCGSIGDSRYMIYDLYSPEDIWDVETAAALDGVALIGDDFAGTHEAYHTNRQWEFGSVSASGSYQPHAKYKSIVEFVDDWYCRP